MSYFVVRWGLGMVLLLSFLLRIAAVLLAVRYVGLSYELPEAYHSLLAFVQVMMPNLLWCTVWWMMLPLGTGLVLDWFGEEETETERSEAELSTTV